MNDATRDPETIQGWWQRWSSANVAIATGLRSGFWAVDGDGDEGAASMRRLELKHRENLPVTVTARTGRTDGSGLHLLWRLPVGVNVRSRAEVVRRVDVRGNGGYIVGPPSTHVSGRQYEWLSGRGPHEIEIAEAPGWLLDLVLNRRADTRSGNRRQRHDWLAMFREYVPEGQRNDAIARLAGYLLWLGVNDNIAAELLHAWSRTHCQPPLSEREVRRTVASITRRDQRSRDARTTTGVKNANS